MIEKLWCNILTMSFYRVYVWISVKYLSLLPHLKIIIMSMPNDTFTLGLSRLTKWYGNILKGNYIVWFLFDRVFIKAQMQEYSQSCDAKAIHRVFKHNTSSRNTSTSQLRTMQSSSRIFACSTFRRCL